MIKTATLDLKQIKLIIWDLDETYWKGTLSEEHITPIKSNIELITKLTEKGIINSICSKNDYDKVQKAFSGNEFGDNWNYFVFNSINWEPKGKRIQNMIKEMQLRDTNVLFIDDNVSNLNEAKFYCPNIKTMLPDKIELIEQQLNDITKDDSKLSRLNQYKILETKSKEKKQYSSNEDFLYNSGIIVEIHENCLPEIDRITELVHRSNQLNYTKLRSTKEELIQIINNSNYKNAYITVKDNWGDYGIVGFYSLDISGNKLLHFLFSCRTLGMGIEQYVYSCLNYPELEVNGEVVNDVCKNKTVGWINYKTKDDQKISAGSKNPDILFQGPCDLDAIMPYLNYDKKHIYTTFQGEDINGIHNKDALTTTNVLNAINLSETEKNNLITELPFLSIDALNQKINKHHFDVIIFSLLHDCRSILYKNKKTNLKISLVGPNKPFKNDFESFTNKNDWQYFLEEKVNNYTWTIDLLEKLLEEWECIGTISADEIIDNIKKMTNSISKDTQWIFILGSTIEPDESIFEQTHPTRFAYEQYKKCNQKLKDGISSLNNTCYIDLSDIVEDNSNYNRNINHFNRKTYYKLAQKIQQIINDKLGTKNISAINKLQYYFNGITNISYKILRKIILFLFSVGNIESKSSGANLGKYIQILGIKIKIR